MNGFVFVPGVRPVGPKVRRAYSKPTTQRRLKYSPCGGLVKRLCDASRHGLNNALGVGAAKSARRGSRHGRHDSESGRGSWISPQKTLARTCAALASLFS